MEGNKASLHYISPYLYSKVYKDSRTFYAFSLVFSVNLHPEVFRFFHICLNVISEERFANMIHLMRLVSLVFPLLILGTHLTVKVDSRFTFHFLYKAFSFLRVI